MNETEYRVCFEDYSGDRQIPLHGGVQTHKVLDYLDDLGIDYVLEERQVTPWVVSDDPEAEGWAHGIPANRT